MKLTESSLFLYHTREEFEQLQLILFAYGLTVPKRFFKEASNPYLVYYKDSPINLRKGAGLPIIEERRKEGIKIYEFKDALLL